MTLDRSNNGTGVYRPPVAGVTSDLLGIARGTQVTPDAVPRSTARFTTSKADKDGDLYYWKLELYDTRGGLNLQRGKFDEGHDRLASSTLDGRFYHNLTLPFLTTLAATPTTAQDAAMRSIFWATTIDGMAIAAGASNVSTGNGPVLFKETSATDPTIAAITYNPGSNSERVRSAQAIVIGGITNLPRLAVGFVTLGVKVFSDLAGTVAGTMHNDTFICDGIIQTPINDSTLLIYSNGAIRTLTASSAINTQPTVALSSVPTGGWAIGLVALGGGPVRAYWVWPVANNTPTFGATPPTYALNRIVSTNLQGTDPQELQSTGLTNVYAADKIRDGIVATDGSRIIYHNGRAIKNLGWNKDRLFVSGRKQYITGFWVKGTELYIRCVEETTLNWWIEKYNWDLDAWYQVSVTTADANGFVNDFNHGGKSLPVSEVTEFLHHYKRDSSGGGTATHGWYRQFQPHGLENIYELRKTTTGSSGTGQQFEPSGNATWPAMQIPGLEGWAMAVRRISGNPQIDIGGGTPTTNPSVAVSCGGQTATFVYGQTQGRQEFPFWDNQNVVYELQPVITLTQQAGGTDPTRTTSQAFPIVIEGVARRPDFYPGADIGDFTR